MMHTDREIWAARALIAATTDAELGRRGQAVRANAQEIASAAAWAERQFPDVRRVADSKDSAERTWDSYDCHVIQSA